MAEVRIPCGDFPNSGAKHPTLRAKHPTSCAKHPIFVPNTQISKPKLSTVRSNFSKISEQAPNIGGVGGWGGGGWGVGVRSQNYCYTMWGLPQITNPRSRLPIQAPEIRIQGRDFLSKLQIANPSPQQLVQAPNSSSKPPISSQGGTCGGRAQRDQPPPFDHH